MFETDKDPRNNRISQLLGVIFILFTISAFTTALHPSGFWHELGVNLTSGFICLAITVLVVENLLKKHYEERYDPHRQYMFSALLRAISDVLSPMLPIEHKPTFKIASFGKYTATYYPYGDIQKLRNFYHELFHNSFKESYNLKGSMNHFIEPLNQFMEKTRQLRREFFTLFTPEMLEMLLKIEDDYYCLDIIQFEVDNPDENSSKNCAEACLLILLKILFLQRMILQQASETMTIKESQEKAINDMNKIEKAMQSE